MATTVAIGGGDGSIFADEDKVLLLEVLDTADVPVDITGWPILFDVRKTDNAADPALLSKVATIVGAYNVTRSANTQRAQVVLTDVELHDFKGSNLPTGAGAYRHSWKRMTADFETVLCRGDFLPEKATAP